MKEIDDNLAAELAEYVDGSLEGEKHAATRARIEKMLDDDAELQTLVTRMMIDSERVRALPRLSPEFDLSEKVRTRLERESLLDSTMSLTTAERPRRFGPPSLAMAAGVILAVSLGVVGWSVLNQTNRTGTGGLVLDPDLFKSRSATQSDGPSSLAIESAQPVTPEISTLPASASDSTSGAEKALLRKPQDQPAAKNSGEAFNATASATGEQVAPAEPSPTVLASSPETLASVAAASSPSVADALETTAGEKALAVADAINSELPVARPEAVIVIEAGVETGDVSETLRGIRTRLATLVLSPDAFAAEVSDGNTDSPAVGFVPEPRRGVLDAISNIQSQLDVPDQPVEFIRLLKITGDEIANISRVMSELKLKEMDQEIQVGDELTVTLVDRAAFGLRSSRNVSVTDSGVIRLPELSDVSVVGLSPLQAAQSVAVQYVNDDLTRRPAVMVEVLTRSATRKVARDILDDQKAGVASSATRPTTRQKQEEQNEQPPVSDVLIVIRGSTVGGAHESERARQSAQQAAPRSPGPSTAPSGRAP